MQYGEKLSPLPGKVFGNDQGNNERFRVKRESSGYVVLIYATEIVCQQARSPYPGISSHMNKM